VSWGLYFGKAARKDAAKLKGTPLHAKVSALLDLIEQDPFKVPPPYERLVGDLDGFLSRRINLQHRLVYRVDKKAQRVFVERMWTHYE
jgi:toxin YoeB